MPTVDVLYWDDVTCKWISVPFFSRKTAQKFVDKLNKSGIATRIHDHA